MTAAALAPVTIVLLVAVWLAAGIAVAGLCLAADHRAHNRRDPDSNGR